MADDQVQQQLVELEKELSKLQKERESDARALNDVQQSMRCLNVRVYGLPEVMSENRTQLDRQFRLYTVSLGIPPAEVEGKRIFHCKICFNDI
jgi:hypothetical protein